MFYTISNLFFHNITINLTLCYPSATHAEVWFVDFGNKDKVLVTDLFYLNPEHVELPAQAIPLQVCELFFILVFHDRQSPDTETLHFVLGLLQ